MGKDIKHNIQKLIREIEVYRSHSLFVEAKEKCKKLEKLVRQSDKVKNKQKLLALVSKKIRDLESDARKFEAVGASVQMSTTEQDIIKELFPLSAEDGDDSAAMESAAALLVFGQFEKALSEFAALIKIDSLRVDAAKNILRCHIGLSSFDNAVSQYQDWYSSGQFPSDQLIKIHTFLQDILEEKKVGISLPKPESTPQVVEDDIEEDEFVDILSILIPPDELSQEGEGFSLDVGFQKGNIISLIIPIKNKPLIDHLKVGLRLDDVVFFSPAIIFKDSCVVSDIRKIKSGPKKGDYTLIIKILAE